MPTLGIRENISKRKILKQALRNLYFVSASADTVELEINWIPSSLCPAWNDIPSLYVDSSWETETAQRPALTFTTLMEQITSDNLDVFSWWNYKILEMKMIVDVPSAYFSKILDIVFSWPLPSRRNSRWFGNDLCHLCFEGSYGFINKGE